MDDYNGYIYLITNTVNGKKYIGRHKRYPGVDPLDDGYIGSGGKHYQNAILEYGIDNFKKTILDIGPYTLEEAIEKEKYYIALYKAVESEEYYNECYDSNPPSMRGKKLELSEESREKRRAKWLGKNNPMYHSDQSGPNNPMYGKRGEDSPRYGMKNSMDSRLKMSVAASHREVMRLCDNCGREFIAGSARAHTCPTCKDHIQSQRDMKLNKKASASAKLSSIEHNPMRGKRYVYREPFTGYLLVSPEDLHNYREEDGWIHGRRHYRDL